VKKEIEQREKIEKLALDLEKANVRLRELDNLKSEFLSFASHQLRSPLTAIHGYTSMLLEGDFGEIPEKIKPTVETLDKSSQSLIKIVNDFLNISRIEQGRMQYDFSQFDLKELVEEVIAEQRPNVEVKGLAFTFIPEQSDSYSVNADRGKLKQVIGNILDNSIKYTPSGSIQVSLNHKTGLATISITDTGIGIDPEEIPKLFSKFSRAKDAHKTNVTGTGLGLFVAKQMIEAQKGKIWVESKGKGTGSTFFIQFEAK
jgi:signal transduction histidine kinase